MKSFYRHLSQRAEIQNVDEDLLDSIRGGLRFILGSPEEWWYADECYQTLRDHKWHDVQMLDTKLKNGGTSLNATELDLAAEVVECAEIIRLRTSERRTSALGGIGAIAGLAATVIGVIAILG